MSEQTAMEALKGLKGKDLYLWGMDASGNGYAQGKGRITIIFKDFDEHEFIFRTSAGYGWKYSHIISATNHRNCIRLTHKDNRSYCEIFTDINKYTHRIKQWSMG